MKAEELLLEELIETLDSAFEKRSWHGPNLSGSVRGVDAVKAAWRPGEQRHNIWEIAVHAAYWKYAVRRRLTGEKRGSFTLSGSNWFERPERPNDKAWRQDLQLLADEHEHLREAVRDMQISRLEEPAGKEFTLREMIRGAASHDVYHAGQIQLIKKLYRSG